MQEPQFLQLTLVAPLPSFLPSRLSMSTTRLCLSKPLFSLSIDKNSSSRVCSLYLVPTYCLLFQIAVGHCTLGIWVGTGERETDRQTNKMCVLAVPTPHMCMQKMSFVIRGMESELCDHQRFHMETWSQHDAHASLVCTLCPLCWYKLYPVACYWAGKVWLWRLFFFLVSKLLSDLLKYEIWVLAQQQWFLFYFILWWILGKFWPWNFFKWNIFRLKIPVSMGQICQAFEFVFSFGIYFWHSF